MVRREPQASCPRLSSYQGKRTGLGLNVASLRRPPCGTTHEQLLSSVYAERWSSARAGVEGSTTGRSLGLGRRGRPRLASSMVVYGEGRYCCTVDGIVRATPREASDLAVGLFEPRCPRCREPLALERVEEDAASDPRNVYAATKSPRSFSHRRGRAKPRLACARCGTATCTDRACLATPPMQVWPRCFDLNSPPDDAARVRRRQTTPRLRARHRRRSGERARQPLPTTR